MGKVAQSTENPHENLDIPLQSVYNDSISSMAPECNKCPCRTFAFSEITVICKDHN